MAITIHPDSDLAFLHEVARACRGRAVGRDVVWQVAPVMASIPYRDGIVPALERLEESIADAFPRLAEHGRRRASRAYESKRDTLTKPSYWRRLWTSYPGAEEPQVDVLESRLVAEPTSGGLVFSVFHPKDLQDRRRPGYVPCLVSGSLLLHGSALQLNAFFRSQSIVEFGIHDLIFLRRFQLGFIKAVDTYPGAWFPVRGSLPKEIQPGPMNLHLARAIVQHRLARGRSGHLLRSDIFDPWVRLVASFIEEEAELAGTAA